MGIAEWMVSNAELHLHDLWIAVRQERPAAHRLHHLSGRAAVRQGHGVSIEKEVEWPKGGKSLYFRDPTGNSVELVTPGVWGLPSGW